MHQPIEAKMTSTTSVSKMSKEERALRKAAREAAQRAEQERAQEEEQQRLKGAYPGLLMELLEQASKEGLHLSVEEGNFVVHANGVREGVMPYGYSVNGQAALEELSFFVRQMREAREEAERKEQLRQTALNKLSREERAALGFY